MLGQSGASVRRNGASGCSVRGHLRSIRRPPNPETWNEQARRSTEPSPNEGSQSNVPCAPLQLWGDLQPTPPKRPAELTTLASHGSNARPQNRWPSNGSRRILTTKSPPTSAVLATAACESQREAPGQGSRTAEDHTHTHRQSSVASPGSTTIINRQDKPRSSIALDPVAAANTGQH